MSGQAIGRIILYSFLCGVAALIIYVIISLIVGTFSGNTLLRGLGVGAITFVIALAFYLLFTIIFPRRKRT